MCCRLIYLLIHKCANTKAGIPEVKVKTRKTGIHTDLNPLTVWHITNCVSKYKIESPGKKEKHSHAFPAFYVQLLNISTKTLAVSLNGICRITANTMTAVGSRETHKRFDTARKTLQTHISVTSDGSRYKKRCLLTIIATLKKEMFIVKINLTKLLDGKKKGGKVQIFTLFLCLELCSVSLWSGKEPRFFLKSMLHLDFHFWSSPPSLKCLTVHCFRVLL